MSKIDLSKAKVGDKFRTRGGNIVTFVGVCRTNNNYRLLYDNGFEINVRKDGKWSLDIDTGYDLVEQVFEETEPKVTFEEPEPKPSFAFPKMDEFDKASKELMQTLKSQLGNVNNEQRFARRERIVLALIHIMGVDRLYDLVENTTTQDNLKDLVDIVESIIGR